MSTGSIEDLKIIEGFATDEGGLRMHGEYFTYRCELGLVSGSRLTLKFTLDGSRRQVWPFVTDWNTFMNPVYYTSHAIGDLEEGQTYRATHSPDDLDGDHQYRLDKLLAEYVIVQSQWVPKTGDLIGDRQIGLGRVPAGSQVVTLDQFERGRTEVGFFSEHATLMAEPQDADAMSDEEAMVPWHPVVDTAAQLWRDEFVPALRKLVAESAA